MKDKIVLLTILFFIVAKAYGFDSHTRIAQDTIYSFMDVDISPQPEAGMQELYKQWSKNAKYPVDARRSGVEGKVFIYFVVDENGVIMETGVQSGIGQSCDEEALAAFKKVMLKWKPGVRKGKNVKVRMLLPFVFKLG